MKSAIEWLFPRTTPELAENEIHVWRSSLNWDQATLRGFESDLAEDERARAERFMFDLDREHFIAAHGFLRNLLGEYLHCPSKTIDFTYGPHGKPLVTARGPQPQVCFNLSHSHGVALIAIGCKRRIGIDIELIRPEVAGEEIAKRYFSAKEIDELSKLPVESRAECFFLCWTRKEAYLKARGDGLHVPLDSFSVSVSPDAPPTLSSADESCWRMESFAPSLVSGPQYVAAVVAEGKDWRPRYFEWKRVDSMGRHLAGKRG
jgi:4'-phosphopantetheinyl transferase